MTSESGNSGQWGQVTATGQSDVAVLAVSARD